MTGEAIIVIVLGAFLFGMIMGLCLGYDEAVKMAIEVLKCSETPKSSEQHAETSQTDHIAESGKKVCVDTISRQAAIDAIDKALSRTFTEPCGEMILKDVPSAQPEIIRCKDCKYNVSSHKCLHPESFFLVPDDDFYCGYAERRTDERTD